MINYPLADPPEYGDSDYKQRGGKIFTVPVEKYLALVPRLDLDDEETQDNIEDLAGMINNGRNIDPPTLYVSGDQVIDHDGRHRAYAAQSIGIKQIPVLVIDQDSTPVTDFNFKPQVKKTVREIIREEIDNVMSTMVIRRPLYKFYDPEMIDSDELEEDEEVVEEAMIRNYAGGLSLDDKHNRIPSRPIRASKESDTGVIDPTVAEDEEKGTDRTVKVLSFFDFDDTLVNSLSPEEGWEAYKNKTGEDFPHEGFSGWWDSKESLEMFGNPINEPVKKEYSKRLLEPNSKVILLTNRKGHLHNIIQGILDRAGIKFDAYDYKGETSDKTGRIKSYLEKYPEVQEINVYDDRPEQIQSFHEMKKELAQSNIQVNVFEVKSK